MRAVVEVHGPVITIEPEDYDSHLWVCRVLNPPAWSWACGSFSVPIERSPAVLSLMDRYGFVLVQRDWCITPHIGDRGQA